MKHEVPSGVTSSYGIREGYSKYRYVYINRPSIKRGRATVYKFGVYDGSFRVMGVLSTGMHTVISKHETLGLAQAAMRRLPRPRQRNLARKKPKGRR